MSLHPCRWSTSSSVDTRSLNSGPKTQQAQSQSGEPRARPDELFEIMCHDTVLPLDMTLAAVRQFVWRQSSELTMYYRRKMPLHETKALSASNANLTVLGCPYASLPGTGGS